MKYKKRTEETGYIRVLLALKLRELEHTYDSFEAFVTATGLNSSQVFELLRAQRNIRTDTIETLAKNLKVSLWEFLNAPYYDKEGKPVQNFTVDHEQIQRELENWPKVEFEKLKGGERRDWIESHRQRKQQDKLVRTLNKQKAGQKSKPGRAASKKSS